MKLLSALTLALAAVAVPAAEDAWILAGQSNMGTGKTAYEAALRSLVETQGRTMRAITSAQSGISIDQWIVPEESEYKSRWTRDIVGGIAQAKSAGARIAGMVWYQGETDVRYKSVDTYAARFDTFAANVRREAGEPKLPIIVVQLAALNGYKSEASWGTGLMREVQRRCGARYGATVTAIDCPLNDYIIHVTDASQKDILSPRIVAAARSLVYGGPASGWGPQVAAITLAADPHIVQVRYTHCAGALTLGPTWRQAYTLYRTQAPLGDALPATAQIETWPHQLSVCEAPIGALAANDTVSLRFATPVTAGMALSCAALANAQVGPMRTWEQHFQVVADSAAQAVGFALMPISAVPQPAEVTVPVAPPVPTFRTDEPFQLAVNCLGRYPQGVLPATAEAGPEGWRQAWWNPVAQNESPNLFDSRGRIGTIGFKTDVFYMVPVTKVHTTPDAVLMAGWNKSKGHFFTGLTPDAAYDVCVLVNAMPRKDGAPRTPSLVRLVANMGGKGKKKEADIAHGELNVPTGMWTEYSTPTATNGQVGNYIVFAGVAADADGRICIVVSERSEHDGKVKWLDATLAGAAIRPAVAAAR